MKRQRLLIPITAVIVILGLSACFPVSRNAENHPGETFRDCEICPEMVVVPPGTFIMGSPEGEKGRDPDEGRHRVTISNSFESNSKTLRSANRAFVYAPDTRGRNYLGFRVAKTLE